jgi:hypothetical protein
MSKDSPAQPAAPDYTGAAVAQGQANIEAARTSARLSNPNIVGPYGTQQISYEGDQPTVTQTLNPNAQAALESQQATQKALADLGLQGTTTAQNVMGQAFSPTGGPLQTSLSAPGAVQSSYDMSGLAQMPVNAGTTGQEAIMARLQPALAQQRSAKETQLRNQGLVAGGEAYDADMRNLGYQENDARSQAALQGIGLDTAARAQGFGELQQGANLANTAQAQVQNHAIGGLLAQPLERLGAGIRTLDHHIVMLQQRGDVVPEGTPLLFLAPDVRSLVEGHDVAHVKLKQLVHRAWLCLQGCSWVTARGRATDGLMPVPLCSHR